LLAYEYHSPQDDSYAMFLSKKSYVPENDAMGTTFQERENVLLLLSGKNILIVSVLIDLYLSISLRVRFWHRHFSGESTLGLLKNLGSFLEFAFRSK